MSKPIKPYLIISAIPTGETNEWARGRALLSALVNVNSNLMPEKVGITEPLAVVVNDIDDCEPFWAIADDSGDERLRGNADSFMWKRSRSIKSSGHVIHKHRSKSGRVRPGRFIFRADFDWHCNWDALFEKVCQILKPEYATMHCFGELEQNPKAYSQGVLDSYGFNDHVEGLSFHAMEERGLANISWANYFGPNKSSVIPEAAIKSGGFAVKNVGDGKLIRVTDDIFGVIDDFAAFSNRRVKLKAMFLPGTFRIDAEPRVGDAGASGG